MKPSVPATGVRRKHSAVLGAAVAAALVAGGLLAPSRALAQQRVGSDGHALDANNRLNSGGYNTGPSGANHYSSNSINNDIVYGDITGGRGFLGGSPVSGDPTAFRGVLAGSGVDRFVSGSTGTTTNGVVTDNAQVVRPFLADSRGVAPPPNFTQQPFTGGYVPAGAINRAVGDGRLGSTTELPTINQPAPGELLLPGQVDNGQQPSAYLAASPLYGVQELQGNGAGATSMSATSGAYGTADMGGAPVANMDAGSIERYRAENRIGSTAAQANLADQPAINSANLQNGQQMNTNPLANPANMSQPNQGPNGGPNGNGPNGQQGPGQGALQVQGALPVNASINGGPLNGSLNTGQGYQVSSLKPVVGGQRSPTYEALRNAFEMQNNGKPLNPVQVAALNNQQIRENTPKKGDLDQTANNRQPGMPGQPGQPNGMNPAANATPNGMTNGGPNGTPNGMANPPKMDVNAPVTPGQVPQTANHQKPIVITSFSQDEPQKGTKELLKKAEDLMKAGKYTSALEQYDMVDQVAPNNPWGILGRANAELGASYYQSAETHLRQAFTQDPALLKAEYDLHSFIGDERLQYLVNDLKGITQANPGEARPAFLLAYISYNTGDERRAAAYLDLAQKRAGGKDGFYKLVRQNWDLPADADMNK